MPKQKRAEPVRVAVAPERGAGHAGDAARAQQRERALVAGRAGQARDVGEREVGAVGNVRREPRVGERRAELVALALVLDADRRVVLGVEPLEPARAGELQRRGRAHVHEIV